jgi:hypothetical protein
MRQDSFWDRLMARLDASRDEDEGVDESMIAFHLLFIVPILLVLVTMMRR